jgi:hypothetical protein
VTVFRGKSAEDLSGLLRALARSGIEARGMVC